MKKTAQDDMRSRLRCEFEALGGNPAYLENIQRIMDYGPPTSGKKPFTVRKLLEAAASANALQLFLEDALSWMNLPPTTQRNIYHLEDLLGWFGRTCGNHHEARSLLESAEADFVGTTRGSGKPIRLLKFYFAAPALRLYMSYRTGDVQSAWITRWATYQRGYTELDPEWEFRQWWDQAKKSSVARGQRPAGWVLVKFRQAMQCFVYDACEHLFERHWSKSSLWALLQKECPGLVRALYYDRFSARFNQARIAIQPRYVPRNPKKPLIVPAGFPHKHPPFSASDIRKLRGKTCPNKQHLNEEAMVELIHSELPALGGKRKMRMLYQRFRREYLQIRLSPFIRNGIFKETLPASDRN